MITEKIKAERLRNHKHLKQLYENKLELAETEPVKEYLKVRIAEIERDIEAAMPIPQEPVLLHDLEAAYPDITETAKEDAKKHEAPPKQKKYVKGVGSSF